MPLRDHFHPPISPRYGWTELHGAWPLKIVEQLNLHLPPEYRAAPNVHSGGFEVDVGAFHDRDPSEWIDPVTENGTASYHSAEPTMTVDVDPLDADEYEVDVYREDDLVAVIELVSPSNKDRPETRDLFAAKCVALLKKGICVSIIDVVTSYRTSLFEKLLDELGWPDRPANEAISAATLRGRRVNGRRRVNTWCYPLILGAPLPTLPLWIDENLAVPLELETSYEGACRAIRLR